MTPPTQLHLALSTCAFGVVPDAVCNVVGGIGSVTQDIGEIIQNPFRWLYHHTLGVPIPQGPGDPGWTACQQDWSQPACPKLIDSLQPGNVTMASEWPRLFSAFAVSGVFIAATACVIRVVRGVFDERVAGMHLIADNIVRLVIVTGALLAPSPGSSLLLGFLTWSTAASGAVAASAATAIAGAFNSTQDLGAVMTSIASTGFGIGGVGDFLVAIPVLLAALGVVYILALYLLRIIQLVFAVATAPIFIGLAVYDPRSRFVQWWLDLFTSAMVLPIALSVCGSLTGAVALLLLGTHLGTIGPGGAVETTMRTLMACFAVLGGVWMTGKAVHGLAWRGFSHGGVTGAVTAASTSLMALPNLAGNMTSALRAGTGGIRFLGGGRDRPGAAGSNPGGIAPSTDTDAIIGAAATGHAAALAIGGVVGRGSHPAADFASQPATASLLRGSATRDAFNRVLSSAVERYAATDAGRDAVGAATAHLDSDNLGAAERVAEYTRLLARDPVLGNALSGAALAGLLHNQAPDVTPILSARAPVLS
jgi:hypothetical protein